MRNGNWLIGQLLGYFSPVFGAVTSEKSGNPDVHIKMIQGHVDVWLSGSTSQALRELKASDRTASNGASCDRRLATSVAQTRRQGRQ